MLASTALSNGLTEIDDDPDSPDGNWMVASGNNANTDVRVSFGTPTGDPTAGTDLQEFKAHVRQFDEGQTGTPQVRIELWENGSLVRAGSNEDVSTSGHTFSLAWNANELATSDGSLVECFIAGTKSGGGPTKRNTVDVGAVEWNVVYTVGLSLVALAGSSDAVSTATGSLAVKKSLAGSSVALSTAAGAVSIRLSFAGVSAAVSTATGAVSLRKALAGVASAVSTASGALSVSSKVLLAGVSAAVSTATGSLSVRKALAGTSTATSTAAGAISLRKALAGVSAGVSTATGAMAMKYSFAGVSAAISTASGQLSIDGEEYVETDSEMRQRTSTLTLRYRR